MLSLTVAGSVASAKTTTSQGGSAATDAPSRSLRVISMASQSTCLRSLEIQISTKLNQSAIFKSESNQNKSPVINFKK